MARCAGLPADERETVEGGLRAVDFLDHEVGLIERELARELLDSEELRRLMTVPGVSLVSAATLLAAVGDVHRFPTPGKLVQLPRARHARAQVGRGQGARPHLNAGLAGGRHMLSAAA